MSKVKAMSDDCKREWFLVRTATDKIPVAAFPDLYLAKALAREKTHELREEYEHSPCSAPEELS